jgi:hypothetical protein
VPAIFCLYSIIRSRNATPPWRDSKDRQWKLCSLDCDKQTKRGKVLARWPISEPDPQLPDGHDFDLLFRLVRPALADHKDKAHTMAFKAGAKAANRRHNKRELRRARIEDAKAQGLSIETEIADLPHIDAEAEKNAGSGAYDREMRRLGKNRHELGTATVRFRSMHAALKFAERSPTNPSNSESFIRTIRIFATVSWSFRQWPKGKSGYVTRKFSPFIEKARFHDDGSFDIRFSADFMDLLSGGFNKVLLPIPRFSPAATSLLLWLYQWKREGGDCYRTLESLAAKIGLVASDRRYLKHRLIEVVDQLARHEFIRRRPQHALQWNDKGLVRLRRKEIVEKDEPKREWRLVQKGRVPDDDAEEKEEKFQRVVADIAAGRIR